MQYLRQGVIIYITVHSAVIGNCWSCKYSAFSFAVTRRTPFYFLFVSPLSTLPPNSPGLLSSKAAVTQTAAKLARRSNRTWFYNREGDILFCAQVEFMLCCLAYSTEKSIEHQQLLPRNGQQHILFTTSSKWMDLFGSAPNLKCGNESVSYNAVVSLQTPSSNRADSHMGFDSIVPRELLGKLHHPSQSQSV